MSFGWGCKHYAINLDYMIYHDIYASYAKREWKVKWEGNSIPQPSYCPSIPSQIWIQLATPKNRSMHMDP